MNGKQTWFWIWSWSTIWLKRLWIVSSYRIVAKKWGEEHYWLLLHAWCHYYEDTCARPRGRGSVFLPDPDGGRHLHSHPRGGVRPGSGSSQVGWVCWVAIQTVLTSRRYRLLPRFKARLTNTPYEDIVISEGKPNKPSPAWCDCHCSTQTLSFRSPVFIKVSLNQIIYFVLISTIIFSVEKNNKFWKIVILFTITKSCLLCWHGWGRLSRITDIWTWKSPLWSSLCMILNTKKLQLTVARCNCRWCKFYQLLCIQLKNLTLQTCRKMNIFL